MAKCGASVRIDHIGSVFILSLCLVKTYACLEWSYISDFGGKEYPLWMVIASQSKYDRSIHRWVLAWVIQISVCLTAQR